MTLVAQRANLASQVRVGIQIPEVHTTLIAQKVGPFSVHRMLPFTDNAQQTWNKQPLGVILIHKMHRVGMYPCWEMDLSC